MRRFLARVPTLLLTASLLTVAVAISGVRMPPVWLLCAAGAFIAGLAGWLALEPYVTMWRCNRWVRQMERHFAHRTGVLKEGSARPAATTCG